MGQLLPGFPTRNTTAPQKVISPSNTTSSNIPCTTSRNLPCTTYRMYVSNVPLATLLLLVRLETILASVAVGVGSLNPENSSECLDPDTGLSHTLGTPWSILGLCGQAQCELRGEAVFISYSFCGNANAEYPCYLSSEPSLPYPFCCPRSHCPSDLDLHTNEIDTDYEDELQMAANNVEDNIVSVAAPEQFMFEYVNNGVDDINYDGNRDGYLNYDANNYISNYDTNFVSYDTRDFSESDQDYEMLDWDTLFGVESSQ